MGTRGIFSGLCQLQSNIECGIQYALMVSHVVFIFQLLVNCQIQGSLYVQQLGWVWAPLH
jgi:hypothetical protein